MFECDLVFEKARIRIVDFGTVIERYVVQPNQHFIGYRDLVIKCVEKTALLSAMAYASGHIYNILSRHEELICSARDALLTMKVCSHLQEGIVHDALQKTRTSLRL